MITFTQGTRQPYETLAGRIVLISDGSQLGGFAAPFRVIENSGGKTQARSEYLSTFV